MSSLKYYGTSFSIGLIHYTKSTLLKDKINNEDKSKYRNNVLNQSVVTHVLKPVWIAALTDAILSNNLTIYSTTYPDSKSFLKRLAVIQEHCQSYPVHLEKGQQLHLIAKNGGIFLSIETSHIENGKRTRSYTEIDDDTLQKHVTDYVTYSFRKFLPTCLSTQLNTIRAAGIPPNDDLRVRDYYIFNVHSGINMTKSDFILTCAPIDIFYASTFSRNYGPDTQMHLTGTTLLLLSSIGSSHIGEFVTNTNTPLSPDSPIGSVTLDYSRGKAVKIATSLDSTRTISIPMIPTSSAIVESDDIMHEAEEYFANKLDLNNPKTQRQKQPKSATTVEKPFAPTSHFGLPIESDDD